MLTVGLGHSIVGWGRGVWPHHTASAIAFFSSCEAVVVMVTLIANAREVHDDGNLHPNELTSAFSMVFTITWITAAEAADLLRT